jgi:hypothetical protein
LSIRIEGSKLGLVAGLLEGNGGINQVHVASVVIVPFEYVYAEEAPESMMMDYISGIPIHISKEILGYTSERGLQFIAVIK